MKKILFLQSALMMSLVISQVAMAEMAGGKVEHELACRSVDGKLGVNYSLQITTQALAPEYFVRGCSLSKKVVSPNVEAEVYPLSQLSQDAQSVTFESGDFKVTLDKETFTANIYIGSKLEYTCMKN